MVEEVQVIRAHVNAVGAQARQVCFHSGRLRAPAVGKVGHPVAQRISCGWERLDSSKGSEGNVAIAGSGVGATCIGAEAPPEIASSGAGEANIGIPLFGWVPLEA